MAGIGLYSCADCGKPLKGRRVCRTCGERRRRLRLGLKTNARFGQPLSWLKAHAGFDKDACLTFPFGSGGRRGVTMNGHFETAARVMCRLVHGDPPSQSHQAAHSCGRGLQGCVSPTHLRWATPKENQGDRKIHGTECKGESHGCAKLNEKQVYSIISMKGRKTQTEIADLFHVSKSTISHIHRGLKWKHLQNSITS